MKKTAIILGTALLLFTASVNAQNDSSRTQPAMTQQETLTNKQPVTATTTATNSGDKWNNWSADKYKMLPMPEPLTTEKIFPVLGHYSVSPKTEVSNTTTTNVSTSDNTTATSASSSDVTITLDETNKGIVWVEGLPQGKIKAYLRKSPSTYMIPAQKTVDEKDLPQGVLIYDKDANTLDVCIGCTYNAEDPASSLNAPQPVVEEQPVVKTKSKNKKAVAKVKVKPVKTWRYSGSKTDGTASISTSPSQQ